MPEEIKQEENKEAKLVEVPTQYSPAIQLPNGEVIDERTLLVTIYNDLQLIKKSLV